MFILIFGFSEDEITSKSEEEEEAEEKKEKEAKSAKRKRKLRPSEFPEVLSKRHKMFRSHRYLSVDLGAFGNKVREYVGAI